MKRIYLFLVAALAMSVCSCGVSPKDHGEEIEDMVKYYIAKANLIKTDIFNMVETSDLKSIESKINKKREESNLSILEALKQIDAEFESKANAKGEPTAAEALGFMIDITRMPYVKQIIENYQKVQISLSDYKEIESDSKSKTWIFSEKRSGIKFRFEVFDLDKEEYTWMCSPDEKSYIAYVNR
ncbi:MAG: hypothetical protein K2O69_04605 [Odoribacter sp.]|nr:hypothetical protein [Odoribacter sp.]